MIWNTYINQINKESTKVIENRMRNQNNKNLLIIVKDSSIKGLLLVMKIVNDHEFINYNTICGLMSISIISFLTKWKRNNEIQEVYR